MIKNTCSPDLEKITPDLPWYSRLHYFQTLKSGRQKGIRETNFSF